MLNSTFFHQNQKRFARELSKRYGAITAIVPCGHEKDRNGDTFYPFRPDSPFYYLTGLVDPEAVLVIQSEGSRARSILFANPETEESRTWTGQGLNFKSLEKGGIYSSVRPLPELGEKLSELLNRADALVYQYGRFPKLDAVIWSTIDTLKRRKRQAMRPPLLTVDPSLVLDELRVIKHASELAVIREACAITVDTFSEIMTEIRPGVGEYEVDAAIVSGFRKRGADGESYDTIVAGGVSATTLHYSRNSNILKAGDLVLIDAGCELNGYAADITRTYPVSGRFTAEQREIYDLVLKAEVETIRMIRPGITRDSLYDKAARILTEGLIRLGFLSGSLQKNLKRQSYRDYFMHGIGHYLGLDVHDAGDYYDGKGRPRKLAPGMVLTIEPGLYFHPSKLGKRRLSAYGGIGVRIEDDILVTARGHENLTGGLVKSASDIERGMHRSLGRRPLARHRLTASPLETRSLLAKALR